MRDIHSLILKNFKTFVMAKFNDTKSIFLCQYRITLILVHQRRSDQLVHLTSTVQFFNTNNDLRNVRTGFKDLLDTDHNIVRK